MTPGLAALIALGKVLEMQTQLNLISVARTEQHLSLSSYPQSADAQVKHPCLGEAGTDQHLLSTSQVPGMVANTLLKHLSFKDEESKGLQVLV